ncbi:MAG TPA: hypothetical protein VK745_03880 [Polyangiaceae bacterium]|jgi:hypothetical protein|nr:hypothetical protein [Polyangiaceae bacterium]
MATSSTHGSSSLFGLGLAWLAVGVPLLWGVAQTVIKALPLFQ